MVTGTEMVPRTEGMQFALSFLRDESLTPAQIATSGERAVEFLQQRIGMIEDARGTTHFVLGGVIQRLHEDDVWKFNTHPEMAEYWTWGDFCRNVLNMSIAKANALRRIWVRARSVEMSPEAIEELGWNCSAAILRVARSTDDVQELIGEYRESPSKSAFLESLASKSMATVGAIENGSAIAKKIERVVFLTKEELQVFDETVERAAGQMHRSLGMNTSQTECVLFIFTQWRHFISSEGA